MKRAYVLAVMSAALLHSGCFASYEDDCLGRVEQVGSLPDTITISMGDAPLILDLSDPPLFRQTENQDLYYLYDTNDPAIATVYVSNASMKLIIRPHSKGITRGYVTARYECDGHIASVNFVIIAK